MSNIESYTPNFKLKIPDFNVATWHDEIKYNFTTIDALIANFVSSVGFKGEWKKVTTYTVGDTVYISDKESEHYGELYQILVQHTTDASNFDTYLSQHAEYYTIFSIKAAYDAAQLAQDWAVKTDGIVRYLSQDLDYSSKAYAIGGVGTETNNSKYYSQVAQAAATNANVTAVGTDLLDAQSNIKNVSNNMTALTTINANITKLVDVYNNLEAVSNISDHMSAILACAADLPNINQKANKNDAELTGIPTAPTTNVNTNTNQIATTAFIHNTLAALYPVGSIYIGTQVTCPLATLISGSIWNKIEGRYLLASGTLNETSETYSATNTVSAGLPNITGKIGAIGVGGTISGCFYRDGTAEAIDQGGDSDYNVSMSASRSSAIYGSSTTNRPAAYVVNVWRRTT